ncbi:MAG: sugar phosphate isomerase/epimerase family protein [Fusicatenibacter sp.]
MKLSVFYDHILDASRQSGIPSADLAVYCHDWGIRAVELKYAYLKEHADTLLPELNHAGLSISCLYEFFDFGRNPDTSSAKEMLQTAALLSVSKVLVIPGSLDPQEADCLNALRDDYHATEQFMNHSKAINTMRQALGELTALGQELGVTVTLEDFDGNVQPFHCKNQLLWFMKHVPSLRYTLDMGNFAFCDEDVMLAYETLSDFIVHVHCKDRAPDASCTGRFGRGMGPCAAGEGYIPIRRLIDLLRTRGYDGYLAIEHFGAPDQMNTIRQSAHYLQNCIC